MPTAGRTAIPVRLRQLTVPPVQLFQAGASLDELLKLPCVAIIGSRAVSTYGKQVTATLARELARRGIVIISGLAIGVDSIAHQAALEAGGQTIAVLPGPIEQIYPRSHTYLAQRITKQGGALVSEYPHGTPGLKHHFIERNRLIAGLADVVLITEAAQKSGSLHTARFGLEQGKDILAVPGNITSPGSVGTNNLIKAGAFAVTSYLDVLHALKLDDNSKTTVQKSGKPTEQCILDLLRNGVQDGGLLLKATGLSVSDFNQTITMLEISGLIRSLGSNQWSLA
jgi:DNA processing protein